MKYRLLAVCLFVFAFAKAQQPVTTEPSTPTQTDQVTLVFDATGTALENETGTLYAYTGVTVNGERWQNIIVPDFNQNSGAPQFVNTGGNIYRLNLGSSLESFYGVNPNDVISEICLVVRNASASQQTRPDIFLPVFEAGLNVLITAPDNNEIITAGTTLDIEGDSSSSSADLDLLVNGISIATANGSSISQSYTFSTTGDYTIQLNGSTSNETASNSITVFVPGATVNEARPVGLQNGVNENEDGSVTFLLAAPGKSDVNLIGSFTDWNLSTQYQMKKDGEYFWITVPSDEFESGETFGYQYLVDFDIKIADPFSTLILDPGSDPFIKDGNYPNLPEYPEGQTEGDVSLHTYDKEEYNWTVNDFERPDQENLVIYELLVRDFSDEDSYQAIIDRIDYIEDLGVNAVEFMPLNEFEGTDSWGYNPKFHGAIDKAYGPPEKFKELVDLLHSKGIAVILDVVYNHAFGQSPLVQMWPDGSGFNAGPDNPYLNQTPRHPFNVGTDFNHESPWTKEYVKQTSIYFINEYRLDGFRWDLSKGFTQTNSGTNVGAWGQYDQSRVDILNEYKNDILAATDDDIYMILEHLSDAPEETRLANDGFMLWGNMNTQFGQNSMGYAENSNVFRSYFTSRNFQDQHLVAYAESHDEPRMVWKNLEFGNDTRNNHDASELDTAIERQEAIAAILYSIPGPKMLWQFGEIGYEIDIDQNGRTGRKPIPFEEGYLDNEDRNALYNVTSEMISLKVKYPETFNTRNNNLDLGDLTKRVTLDGPEFDVVTIANFNVVPQSVAPNFTQTGIWYDYFNNETINVSDTNAPITLEAGGYRVYSTQPLDTTASVDDSVVSIDSITMYPNPSSGSISFNQDIDRLIIYNVTGQQVLSITGNQSTYDISSLSSGVYIVDIEKSDSNSTLKLIKR
ncbi:alpha-amylase family glycosyl hydrolase [Nonlabens ponticola]|uniref:T9SS type A sorting domain-containing protein n=1 Tax=Nonlabens ponticola TaxID=2496866 RepID=A0A3S9MWM9_9FLAO|nr:alpha-amylase family glycosyl hydrolase [Nonlabens ponticola]AZQ43523.1 T9SS type A sorting domain-containing protein [Nonlabens ponticola]